MHGVTGRILRLLALAVLSFPSFRLIIDLSILWLAATRVRKFPASDFHTFFLIAGRDILLAAEINNSGCDGFRLSVAFL